MENYDKKIERDKNAILIRKVAEYLESQEVLGYKIGSDEEVVDFLARIEMGSVESLLDGSEFDDSEKEIIFNLIEEKKGELRDEELPLSEAVRREKFNQPEKKTSWFHDHELDGDNVPY